jgi:hypothetical protein
LSLYNTIKESHAKKSSTLSLISFYSFHYFSHFRRNWMCEFGLHTKTSFLSRLGFLSLVLPLDPRAHILSPSSLLFFQSIFALFVHSLFLLTWENKGWSCESGKTLGLRILLRGQVVPCHGGDQATRAAFMYKTWIEGDKELWFLFRTCLIVKQDQ